MRSTSRYTIVYRSASLRAKASSDTTSSGALAHGRAASDGPADADCAAAHRILIVILGWIAPPVAILVRFGICVDFFVNIVLTLMGYIPGRELRRRRPPPDTSR